MSVVPTLRSNLEEGSRKERRRRKKRRRRGREKKGEEKEGEGDKGKYQLQDRYYKNKWQFLPTKSHTSHF